MYVCLMPEIQKYSYYCTRSQKNMHHKNELTIQIIAKKNNKGVLHIVHGDGAHVFNLFLSLSLSLYFELSHFHTYPSWSLCFKRS